MSYRLVDKDVLYMQLIALCEKYDEFYYKDFEDELGDIYRIFNYRIASYTQFCEQGALWCRGVMYRMQAPGEPPTLVSRPMHKFFNLNENPFTQNLNFKTFSHVELKEDGSLISTYIDRRGHLKLKSKGSISSDQAKAATDFIYKEENNELFQAVLSLVCRGYTVNMEWCAPDNRIVVEYRKPKLVILNAVYNNNGVMKHFRPDDSELGKFVVPRYEIGDLETFFEDIDTLENVEGCIAYMIDNEGYIVPVKVKTTWYRDLHRVKDSINSNKNLYYCIIHDEADDLLAMLFEDSVSFNRVLDMQGFISDKIRKLQSKIAKYRNENKHLNRKEYAIKAKEYLDTKEFGLAMRAYTSDSMDFLYDFLDNNAEYMIEGYEHEPSEE